VIFNEAMHTRITRHVMIEHGLEKAIGTSELSLLYQPIIELESGRMISARPWCAGTIRSSRHLAVRVHPDAEESGTIAALAGGS